MRLKNTICLNVILMGILFTINTHAIEFKSKITTSPSSTTPFVSAPSRTTATKPSITRLNVSCITPGSKLTVYGTSLKSEIKSELMLGFSQLSIKLQVTSWGSSIITATVPNDSRVKEGVKFFVGIYNLKRRAWISNLDKTITVCSNPVISKAGEVNEEYPVYDNNYSTEIYLPSGQGSLIDRPLPPPPNDILKSKQVKKYNKKYEPNELIVISNNMAEAIILAEELSQYDFRVKKRKVLKSLGLVISTFRSPASIDLPETAVNIRKAFPEMWADVNHRYNLLGDNRNTHAAKNLIKWNQKSSQCGKGLRIGLVDSGVYTEHPALKSQKIETHSVLSSGIKAANKNHGTAIATLLVGSYKSKTLSGLMPAAKLYSVSVFRERGENIDTTAEWIVTAIDWLLSKKVNVINMSIGGPRNLLVDVVLQRTIKSGVPVIAAAGNGGANAAPAYPAAQPGVIAVTAVDSDLELYSKATQGKYIDFAAPGVDIWAGNANGRGKFVTGTSFAVPFVTAGIVSQVKKLGSREAYKRLQKKAKDIGKKGKDSLYGWGFLMADKKCN